MSEPTEAEKAKARELTACTCGMLDMSSCPNVMRIAHALAEAGKHQQRMRDLLVRVNQLLGCGLTEIQDRRPELMAEISQLLSEVPRG